MEACSGTKFWGFAKLDETALATSQTVNDVVWKLSNINKWMERLVLQIEVGDIV